jgi:lysozyme family protein
MIATEIFEQAVNLGTKQATKHLQEALNILNQNQRFYADIKTDGIFGPQTMDALDKCMEVYANLKLLYNVLNILQGKYYITLMKRTPKFEKYIGWFTRINCGRTK